MKTNYLHRRKILFCTLLNVTLKYLLWIFNIRIIIFIFLLKWNKSLHATKMLFKPCFILFLICFDVKRSSKYIHNIIKYYLIDNTLWRINRWRIKLVPNGKEFLYGYTALLFCYNFQRKKQQSKLPFLI